MTPTTAAPSAAGFEPARPVSCHATFAATSEDEHAVSNATEGPRRSKRKDARPGATDANDAVAESDDDATPPLAPTARTRS